MFHRGIRVEDTLPRLGSRVRVSFPAPNRLLEADVSLPVATTATGRCAQNGLVRVGLRLKLDDLGRRPNLELHQTTALINEAHVAGAARGCSVTRGLPNPPAQQWR